VSVVVDPRLINFLFRVALAFEPLAPRAISFVLSRELNGWKQEGLIDDYKIHSKRLGKFHYKIEVDFEVSRNQVHHFFTNVLPSQSKTYGRWINA
jgi:hypothetical protein